MQVLLCLAKSWRKLTMFKPLTAALLLVIVMSGCEDVPYTSDVKQPIIEVRQGIIVEYKEITIDSCQYIIVYNDNTAGQSVVHKGNCNNPIHKAK